MKASFVKGSTSRILTVFIQDSSSSTGAGLGSLDEGSSIVGGYVREGDTGVALAVDENVTTEGTYEAPSTVAHVRIGTPANMRTGWYELHFHNDLFAAGADTVSISLGGASDMADLAIEVQLTTFDLNDGVRGGLTSLPNAAVNGAGGLLTSAGGALDLDTQLANTHEITAARMGALTDWLNGERLDLLLDAIKVTTDSLTDLATLVDAIWDEALTGAVHNGATTAGRRLRQASDSAAVLHEGTAQAGGATTITLAAGASATNDIFHDAFVSILTGTGAGQIRAAIGYDGGTKVLTVSEAWVVNPAVGSEYVISGSASSDLHTIQESVTEVTRLKAALATGDFIAADTTLIEGADATDTLLAAVATALATTTYAEPVQGAPPATASIEAKLAYLYKQWRNKFVEDSTTGELYDDAGTTVDHKRTISDAGGDFTHGEMGSGP